MLLNNTCLFLSVQSYKVTFFSSSITAVIKQKDAPITIVMYTHFGIISLTIVLSAVLLTVNVSVTYLTCLLLFFVSEIAKILECRKPDSCLR